MTSSDTVDQIALTVEPHCLGIFVALLSGECRLEAMVGCSINDFFCHQLDIPEDYLRDRVQTIFLNGKAVDNPAKAIISNGDSLALSASLPGLVGAVLRKGGVLSPMRAAISHNGLGDRCEGRKGHVSVKLFNLIGRELGPYFLAKGIEVTGERLKGFLNANGESLANHCTAVTINDTPVDPAALVDYPLATPWVRLTVGSATKK